MPVLVGQNILVTAGELKERYKMNWDPGFSAQTSRYILGCHGELTRI